MNRSVIALTALAGVVATSAANAAVYFTFDDPTTPLEFSYVAGSGGGSGSVSYSGAARVDLVVDGTEEGWGVITYSARLTMDLAVGASLFPPLPFADVTGSFTFAIDDGFGGFEDILVGSIMNTGLTPHDLTASGFAGSMSFSNTGFEGDGAFDWTAMNSLAAFFAGNPLFGAQSASFSLAGITPGVFGLNAEGYIPSFNANAAFVGAAEVNPIPTPGSAALLAVAALLGVPRRRS